MSGLIGGGGGNKTPQNQVQSNSSPALGALRVQTSAFGMVMPIVFGQTRITCNLIWYGDFVAIPHTKVTSTSTTSSQQQSGKGGGAGSSSSTSTTEETSYSYQTAVAFGLCEGPVRFVGRVWAGKAMVNVPADLNMTVYAGTIPQDPFGYLVTNHPDQALGYAGTAYCISAAYDLGTSAELPSHSFEIQGYGYLPAYGEANPARIAELLLTDTITGAGFPAERLADLSSGSSYYQYCAATGLLMSPAYTDQSACQAMLSDLVELTNSAIVWSGGQLKIVPYGDQALTDPVSGVTWNPNVTPLYDLTDDDFIGDSGDDPIEVTRSAPSDAGNSVRLEILNRSNQYNIEVVEAKDQAAIETLGARPADPRKAHGFCEPARAMVAAQLLLQRSVYVRNSYAFKLGWKYCLLEPMDLVTLTDPALGLDRTVVRITSVEEDEDGVLSVEAEDFPAGIATATAYPHQVSQAAAVNYYVDPGNVNTPVFFEPPDLLTADGLEVWCAASGGPNWGGCDVWLSTDGATFKKVGRLAGPSRYGFLTAGIPAAAAGLDTTSTLSVDMSISGAQLFSGTRQDADNLVTLLYVSGEFLSYQTATLTGSHRYDLTYLQRGAYAGPSYAHSTGDVVVRMDDGLFRYAYTADRIGTPIYVKFTSFNLFGARQQSLADVGAYTYVMTGAAVNTALPDVTGLTSNFVGGVTEIDWAAVRDFRTVDYEVRQGATWATAQVLGRTPVTSFTAQGDGTYWVSAHATPVAGVHVYSAHPVSIVIAGSILVRNVIATVDEAATLWSGSYSGGAARNTDNTVRLYGTQNMLSVPNMLTLADVLFAGGIQDGIYQVPASHEINAGRVIASAIPLSWAATAQSIYDNVLTIPDVLVIADFLSAALISQIDVYPEIDTAQADHVWQGFRPYMAGMYQAQYFRFRMQLKSLDGQTTPVLSSFIYSIDVPDRVDKGTNVAVPPGGLAVSFAPAFNSLPNVQITVISASAGDDVLLTAVSAGGFTVQVTNAGGGVARGINWIAQGY